jgi:Arc/MetJ-type ribon-helix-helix transcriptional regulator
MKTLEIEIPDQLGRQIEELVRRGWFTDQNDREAVWMATISRGQS